MSYHWCRRWIEISFLPMMTCFHYKPSCHLVYQPSGVYSDSSSENCLIWGLSNVEGPWQLEGEWRHRYQVFLVPRDAFIQFVFFRISIGFWLSKHGKMHRIARIDLPDPSDWPSNTYHHNHLKYRRNAWPIPLLFVEADVGKQLQNDWHFNSSWTIVSQVLCSTLV